MSLKSTHKNVKNLLDDIQYLLSHFMLSDCLSNKHFSSSRVNQHKFSILGSQNSYMEKDIFDNCNQTFSGLMSLEAVDFDTILSFTGI